MALPDRLKARTIEANTPVLAALKTMDLNGVKSLAIVDQDLRLQGVLSIGDIQRAIIRNETLEQPVSNILRTNPKVGWVGMTIKEAEYLMVKYRMEFLPVLKEDKTIADSFFWEDFFPESLIRPLKKLDLPVVVMAGGLGSRMKPLTNVLPKPLVPIGEKSMLEEIFDRFALFGCRQFHVSVNYKADFIEYYILQQNLPYQIDFFREPIPLGTAGSLRLLENKIDKTFFVSNCDILIEQDYSEIYDFHCEHKNEITLVAAMKHLHIPYGTLTTGDHGKLLLLQEKPEMVLKINSGMYILEPHLLEEIPYDSFFHITDLIEIVKGRGGKVGVFPVSERSWRDVGNWSEYIRLTTSYM